MLKRFISSLLIVCLAGLSVPVHAGMLAIDADRAQIYSLLDREEVRNQLQAHGVSPADVKARAARVGVHGGREYHAGWHTALDLRNLMTVSEAITVSAIERKESRGGHFRDDYPDKHEEFAKINVMVKDVGGAMQVSRVPLPPIPAELQQVIEEQKS